jgi:hypothetical protein
MTSFPSIRLKYFRKFASMSSGSFPCFCGGKHEFNGVSYKFRRYRLDTRTHKGIVWVKLDDCKRCGDSIPIVVRSAFNILKDEVPDYVEREHICDSCKPFARKVRIEKYDGVSPGTQSLLDEMEKIMNKLGVVENRLNEIESKISTQGLNTQTLNAQDVIATTVETQTNDC